MINIRALQKDKKELRNLTNKTSEMAFMSSILMYGELEDKDKKLIEGTAIFLFYRLKFYKKSVYKSFL